MPGIRTLAEQLVVSHNTVAKAYTELQHAGVLVLRHGQGAYICAPKRVKVRTKESLEATQKVRSVVEELHEDGFQIDEIRRLFESQLIDLDQPARRG